MDIQNYWQEITNSINDAIFIVDTNGTIIFANASLCRQTGYKLDELKNRPCNTLRCTGCQNRDNCSIDDKHWCHLFAANKKNSTKKCTLTHKDGHLIHYTKTASILNDKDGTTVGAIETFTNITTELQQKQEIESLRRIGSNSFHGMIGSSTIMRQLFTTIQNVSQSEASVLLYGESGTGKELIAKAIHELSPRSSMPYLKVNCANANSDLLEQEMTYSLEAANGGTIFLDQVGDLPPSTQLKLLQILENKTVDSTNRSGKVAVDVRIITSTHVDLKTKIEKGTFREDLYYRINVFPITSPPLRQRQDDILTIANELIKSNAETYGKKIQGLDREVLSFFESYSWPGNIRELRNTIEYAFVTCDTDFIQLHHLPPRLSNDTTDSTTPTKIVSKKQLLINALQQSNGNQSKAAAALGISRVTVWKQIKKFGIEL